MRRVFSLSLVYCPLLLAATMFGSSCSSEPCQMFAAFGLQVEVFDGSQRVCNAVVTARDGGYTEVLAGNAGPPCGYQGAIERRGTYQITVDHEGSPKIIEGVKVKANDCHVVAVKVIASLTG